MSTYLLTLLGFTKTVESELSAKEVRAAEVEAMYPLIDSLIGTDWREHSQPMRYLMETMTCEKI